MRSSGGAGKFGKVKLRRKVECSHWLCIAAAAQEQSKRVGRTRTYTTSSKCTRKDCSDRFVELSNKSGKLRALSNVGCISSRKTLAHTPVQWRQLLQWLHKQPRNDLSIVARGSTSSAAISRSWQPWCAQLAPKLCHSLTVGLVRLAGSTKVQLLPKHTSPANASYTGFVRRANNG